jgi:hypothetical protein
VTITRIALAIAAGPHAGLPRAASDVSHLSTSPQSDLVGGILVLVAALGVVSTILYRRWGGPRDPKGRGIIVAQYTAPANLNLLEAASLLRRDYVGFSAELMSLAVRGNIRILDSPGDQGSTRFSIQFVHLAGTDDSEGVLLAKLFDAPAETLAPGATRDLVFDLVLVKEVAASAHDARTSILARGLLRPASFASGFVFTLGLWVVAAVSFVYLLVISIASSLTSPGAWVAVVIGFLGGFVAILTSFREPVMTAAGADVRDYLLGLREYLQLAEADRMRVLQSPAGAERVDVNDTTQMVELHEQLLPFAVLWGVESQWSHELALRYEGSEKNPPWLISSATFDSSLFAAAMSDLETLHGDSFV